jgi:hypothetical protein
MPGWFVDEAVRQYRDPGTRHAVEPRKPMPSVARQDPDAHQGQAGEVRRPSSGPGEAPRPPEVMGYEVHPPDLESVQQYVEVPPVAVDGLVKVAGLVRLAIARHVRCHAPGELADALQQGCPVAPAAWVPVHEDDGGIPSLWPGDEHGGA